MMKWEREEIYYEGDQYFASLEKSILQAKKTIDFEVYIFHFDAFGKHLLQVLKSVAAKGIQVRILVDGIGSPHWNSRIIKELERENILSKIYHPLPWVTMKRVSFLRVLRFFRLKSFIKSIWKLNRRDHRKICIIDNQIAFLGGMNVSAVHLQTHSGKNAWRDTGVKVEGSEVNLLTEAFQSAWYDHRERLSKKAKNWFILRNPLYSELVKLNDSIRKRRRYHQEMIYRILTCQKRVWITTPYFVPEAPFTRALRFAVWSGADVRILLPKKNDILFMSWANRSYYSSLLKKGVRIYEYLPSILHAKVVIIDEWATVGSTNRNHRSLIHDLEADIVLTHPASKGSLVNQYLKDLEKSQEITLASWERRSKFRLFLERMTLYFRYWV
jgi:cardiolipin synthase